MGGEGMKKITCRNRRKEILICPLSRKSVDRRRICVRAFTLLEVMIAVSIFFMATFSILALVSRCLAQARALQPMQVDANMVAAELSLTNRLEEGQIPPEIIQHFEHM